MVARVDPEPGQTLPSVGEVQLLFLAEGRHVLGSRHRLKDAIHILGRQGTVGLDHLQLAVDPCHGRVADGEVEVRCPCVNDGL